MLVSSFRYAQDRLRFGIASLYADRIELSSWGLLGPRREVVRLDAIAQMDYHPLREGSNLSLFLDTGEEVHLCVDQAHVWRESYENWLRYDVLPSAKLLDDAVEALAVSG